MVLSNSESLTFMTYKNFEDYVTMKFIINVIVVYALLAILVLFGVAMGFIASDSNDWVSQSIRFIFN